MTLGCKSVGLEHVSWGQPSSSRPEESVMEWARMQIQPGASIQAGNGIWKRRLHCSYRYTALDQRAGLQGNWKSQADRAEEDLSGTEEARPNSVLLPPPRSPYLSSVGQDDPVGVHLGLCLLR